MKTTSRKKLLVSSVAMLLVAILALGTATFAWFTASTTATASKIQVKTIKSSELVISKLDKVWGTQLNYQYGYDKDGKDTGAQTLLPVSSANGTSWYTTNAAAKDSYAAASNAEVTLIESNSGYYFVNQLNVKNAGEADVENVSISISLGTESASATKTGYYRIALVPVSDSEDSNTLPTPTAENFFATNALAEGETIPTLTNIFGADDTYGYQALTGTTTTSLSTLVKPNSTLTVDVGLLKGKDATLGTGERNAAYYNLYVWFEGQDQDCKDANAGATIPDITFTVQGDTVTQS